MYHEIEIASHISGTDIFLNRHSFVGNFAARKAFSLHTPSALRQSSATTFSDQQIYPEMCVTHDTEHMQTIRYKIERTYEMNFIDDNVANFSAGFENGRSTLLV